MLPPAGGATAGPQPIAAIAATTMATSPSSRVASAKPAIGIRYVSRKNSSASDRYPDCRTLFISVVIAVLYEWARGLPQPKPLSGIRSEEEDESEVHREAERNLHNRVGVPHGRYS